MTNDKVEIIFRRVMYLLSSANAAGFYMEMRSRFASVEQWKIEKPILEKQAAIDWFAAKLVISEHRFNLEKYVRENKDKLKADCINGTNSVIEFAAAMKVIDKEIETHFEQQILKEKHGKN